jgi:CheY-like chemotaxis protein
MFLSLMGKQVRTANDGAEALDVAAAFEPDVVLLDLGMPRMNGYDAARAMRRQPWGAQAVLIATTGWGQEADIQRTRDAGFDHHLVKPVDPQALMELLSRLATAT